MEAGQQVTPIQGERLRRTSLVYRGIELPDITGYLLGRECEFLVAPGKDGLCAQRATQEIDRLPESVPGLLGVVFRPEEGKQSVTPMETAGCGEGEITKKGGTSGLGKNGTGGSAVSRDQFQGAQSTQFDHCRASRRGVTQW